MSALLPPFSLVWFLNKFCLAERRWNSGVRSIMVGLRFIRRRSCAFISPEMAGRESLLLNLIRLCHARVAILSQFGPGRILNPRQF
jgi:hypothetical protein